MCHCYENLPGIGSVSRKRVHCPVLNKPPLRRRNPDCYTTLLLRLPQTGDITNIEIYATSSPLRNASHKVYGQGQEFTEQPSQSDGTLVISCDYDR